MRLLLIDPYATPSDDIPQRLAGQGMCLTLAATSSAAREMLAARAFDVVLVDLTAAGTAARAILQDRRDGGSVPVIVLVKPTTLAGGQGSLYPLADDWVRKPVDIPELVARINVVHARFRAAQAPTFRAGALSVNPVMQQARVGGTPVHLSRREIMVLEALIRRPGHVVPRAVLEDAIYGAAGTVTSNALETAVSRLRRTLKATASGTRIETVRGIGWRLTPAPATGET